MINKNFQCKPHYDAGNVGESVMIGLGDYRQGELFIEDCNTNKITKLQTFHNIIRFDGSKNKHWTNNYYGDRCGLVIL